MPRAIALTVIAFLLVGTTTVLSQGMYLRFNGGYGLGAGTQSIGHNQTITPTGTSTEGVFGSFGEGLKLGASAGYMFTEHLGAELGFSYWSGKSVSYGSKTTTSDFFSNTWKSWGIVAVPSAVLSAGLKTINPYARVGLVLGLLRTSEEISQRNGASTLQAKVEENGGMSLGYTGALGISIPTGNGVDIFVEAVLNSITYSPSRYEITKYVVDLQDQLPGLKNKTFEYRETLTATDTNVLPAVRRPFSSIGFAIGVRVAL
jgi:hypothetical protein